VALGLSALSMTNPQAHQTLMYGALKMPAQGWNLPIDIKSVPPLIEICSILSDKLGAGNPQASSSLHIAFDICAYDIAFESE